MTEPDLLRTSYGAVLAYNTLKVAKDAGNLAGIVFLGGFRSDMTGTKALFLENMAKNQGRAFLRFDYTGHGQSSGAFLDGCIGDWARDACTAISELTQGPQILVGSSMGGWISLLVAKQMPEKVAGFVGVAAAPDFTEDSMRAGFSEDQHVEMQETGQVALPSDYSDEPYIITRKLIEDGRKQLVLRPPLRLNFPVRLLHGTNDADVSQDVPLQLLSHATCADMRLTLVKGADHRFSTPNNLDLIATAINEVSEAV